MTELLQGGRYELLGKLGEGAQGITFDGLERASGRRVAIKRFSVRGAASWKDVELAEREATVLQSLSHPGLPAHIEHFEEDGALYLVMQKIEGESLLALTRRGGALSRQDVVRFLRDMAGVLDYLHGRSPPVVHRDVNPKNVLRRPDGSFALVDFGAVRDRLKPEGGSTVVGTFGYMAPEQFQGRALPASDVYAVGATALRLLTGTEPEKLPHQGLGIDVGAALGPSFDGRLRDLLARMLEPDPDRRAASLVPLMAELDGDGTGNARSASHRGADRSRRDEEAARRGHARREEEVERPSRRSRKETRRERHRARKARRRGRPLHGPPFRLLLLFGLEVAILVVGIVLGIFVPLLLTLLSIVFGPGLRNAARSTREAGQSAREAMRRAQRFLLEAAPPTEAGGARVDSGNEGFHSPAGQRVDEPEPGVVDTVGTEVEEHDVDERDERRRVR